MATRQNRKTSATRSSFSRTRASSRSGPPAFLRQLENGKDLHLITRNKKIGSGEENENNRACDLVLFSGGDVDGESAVFPGGRRAGLPCRSVLAQAAAEQLDLRTDRRHRGRSP